MTSHIPFEREDDFSGGEMAEHSVKQCAKSSASLALKDTSPQSRVAEEVKAGFSAIRRRLAASLRSVTTARRQGVGDALNDYMARPCKIVAAFEK